MLSSDEQEELNEQAAQYHREDMPWEMMVNMQPPSAKGELKHSGLSEEQLENLIQKIVIAVKKLRFIQHTEQGIFAVRPGKPVQAAMLPVRGGSFLTPVFRGIAGGRMGCFSARLHSGRKFLKSAYGKPHGFEMFRDAAMIIADKSENKPI